MKTEAIQALDLLNQLVYVEWDDSRCTNQWESVDDMKAEEGFIPCRSAGWLTGIHLDHLFVSPHNDPANEHWNGTMFIPCMNVRVIRRIDGGTLQTDQST